MLGATESAKRWARERQKIERAKGYAEGWAEGYAEGRVMVLRKALERLRPIAAEYIPLACVQDFIAETEARLSELQQQTPAPKPSPLAQLTARLRKYAIM